MTQLTALQQQQVLDVSVKQKATLKMIAEHDFSPCYELDARCKANPELLKEFIADPAGVAKREVNYTAPEGFHMHFVDENNVYFPQEGDAISQLHKGQHGKVWQRIEVRTAAGPGCLINCGWCS